MAKSKAKTVDQFQRFTVSITDLKKLVMHQFRQVVKYGPKYHGLLFFIEGLPGIGKTEIQKEILKEMMAEMNAEVSKLGLSDKLDTNKVPKNFPYYKASDYNFWANASGSGAFKEGQDKKGHLEVLNLSAKDAQDFSGLPMIDAKTKLQTFAHPDNLPQEGYGIIFYDEANRVTDMEMKSTLLSLWMDRGVNGHYLGDGFIQIAAGNNFDDERFETEKPDAALKERFRILHLVPSMKEVEAFLEKRYGTHFMLDFLKENQDMCNLVSQSYESAYSPRTIDKTMEILYSMKDSYAENQSLAKLLIGSYLSQTYATKIDQFMNQMQELSLKRIIQDVKLVKKIKKTDMPTMTKLSEEIFNLGFEKYKNKEDLTNDEKVAMLEIIKSINAEAKKTFCERILSDAKGDAEALGDYFIEQNTPMIKELKEFAARW